MRSQRSSTGKGGDPGLFPGMDLFPQSLVSCSGPAVEMEHLCWKHQVQASRVPMDLCALRFFILRVLVSRKEIPPILAAPMLRVPVTSSQRAEAKG